MNTDDVNRLSRNLSRNLRMMRKRKSNDSIQNIADLKDRPLERSRDYEIWVYPDEIHHLFNNSNNQADLFIDNNEGGLFYNENNFDVNMGNEDNYSNHYGDNSNNNQDNNQDPADNPDNKNNKEE